MPTHDVRLLSIACGQVGSGFAEASRHARGGARSSVAPSSSLGARHGQVRRVLAAAGIDALIVSHLPNIFYLANFTGTSATLVLTVDALHFITVFRLPVGGCGIAGEPVGVPWPGPLPRGAEL